MSLQTLVSTGVLSVSMLGLMSAPAFAQDPVPQPPPAAVQPAIPPPGFATQGTATVAGRVSQLLINPNGDVDGLLLEDGMQIQFPPHWSAAVIQLVSVGSVVSVQGFRASSVPVVHATLITNQANNASVADQPPDPRVPPPAQQPLTALQVNGNISRLLYTDRGDLNGLLLNDKTIVHFPPHVGLQLQTTVRTGETLSATGYGTQNRFGRSLEATTLAVNGQPPLTIYGPPPPPR